MTPLEGLAIAAAEAHRAERPEDLVRHDLGPLDEAVARTRLGGVIVTDDRAALLHEELWLEDATEAGFVMRRGEPPRWVRPPGLERRGDDLLVCRRPLAALRVSRHAAALVDAMDRPRPLRELAARAGSSLPRTLRTLNTLVDRGWLVRELPPASHLPPVTVVVPSYRRPGALRRCVRALRAIDYPYLSIVVVDDASDPPLAPAVADLEVAVVRAPRNGGPGTARAIGVEAAGDAGWLAFVDDDCRPSPHWLKRLGAYFDEPYLDVVGGRTRGAPAETPTERYEAVRSSLDMGSVGGPVGPGHPVAYLPTTNLCVRRAAFDAVGGFSVGMRYGEDVDLIWRILSRGGRASYEPRAEVQHDHPRRLAVMLGRRIAYASSEADLSRRHPEAARRWFVPRTTALALASLAAVPRPVGLALGAGVLASIIHETLRKRDRLRRLGVPTSTWEVARAVAREHGASAHHLAEATWRYYSLPLAAAATASPALRRATLPLAALGLALDPRRQRASLSSLTYGALYAAEMSAYQLGVWRGCLHHGSFSPLLPKVRFR